jgi:hypothetical protein
MKATFRAARRFGNLRFNATLGWTNLNYWRVHFVPSADMRTFHPSWTAKSLYITVGQSRFPKCRRHPTGRCTNKCSSDNIAEEMIVGGNQANGNG